MYAVIKSQDKLVVLNNLVDLRDKLKKLYQFDQM